MDRHTAKTILAGMGAAYALLGEIDADTDAHIVAAVEHLTVIILTHLSEDQMKELTDEILGELWVSMAAMSQSPN